MNFNEFQLNNHLIQAIQQCGYTAPTPIQQQAIPFILAGRDLLGLAQTGTGKTAAFILPTVQRLMSAPRSRVRALVIAPTRELAEQIHEFTQTVIRHTGLRSLAIYGGVSKSGQIAKIRQGVDIVVACPGRLLDLHNDKAIDLTRVEVLVLDEADHMFDKGFLPDIRRIVQRLPIRRQNLVFSATMPAEIKHLLENILENPATVQINPSRSVKSISHRLFSVNQNQKTNLLMYLLSEEAMPSTLVFTRTKHKAKQLAQKLVNAGFRATSLQGNLSQNRRQQALEGFKTGAYTILVATDIAARGIDVTGISHVINFDMPDTAEAYIHRTGRTGRAGCTGDALTFATSEDKRLVQVIERSLDTSMSHLEVPQPASAYASTMPPPPVAPKNTSATTLQGSPKGAEKSLQGARKHRRRPTQSNIFGLPLAARSKKSSAC
ncbi:MAG: DEAD/DEAH box helicase [Desulfobulbus sp.]|jgi:superfamily II DNA/RNA helicase|uniref:DEAD/DEAH box helicase n=1 Tax=Desulfobulbus sp. TaxID=895 RepID=UPI002842F667|nr:DEAD/DEAH box helicase [Desulfobulbus sp.]MDR2549139.1 DEAD/DEAH box helicase [Desulfobulbus sp.]